ncbi:MAG: protease complex subunit PrcB family protein [Pseudomonadota bacterium]|nr:protease complex subunit PrcB family protein [Pseudomonadota bacterium]
MNPRLMTTGVLVAGLGACAGIDVGPVTVTTLDSTGYAMCPWNGEEPSLLDVHERAGFEALLSQAGLDVSRVAGWRPDFGRDHVVLVTAGPQPSAGYRVEWIDAALLGDRLRARVEIRPPPVGEMSATVMISPCVIAWVRAPGAREVEVVDARSGEAVAPPVLRPASRH